MSKILGLDGDPRMITGPVKKHLECVWQMRRRATANVLSVNVDHDEHNYDRV